MILLGLVDTVNILTKTKTISYGDVVITTSILINNWKCRKTLQKVKFLEELTTRQQGADRGLAWQFTGEYNGSIAEGLIIEDANSVQYEIDKVEHKRDAYGNNHHTYLVASVING